MFGFFQKTKALELEIERIEVKFDDEIEEAYAYMDDLLFMIAKLKEATQEKKAVKLPKNFGKLEKQALDNAISHLPKKKRGRPRKK